MKRVLLIGTVGAIALVAGGRMAISQLATSTSALAYEPIPSPPQKPKTELRWKQLPTPLPSSQLFSATVPLAQPSINTKRITACAGNRNANFRQSPTLNPSSILGVVAYGESVQLTGRTTQAEGVKWVEAIAPALYPSLEAIAQNRLESNQTGWVASCFLKH
jgi:hypothetical protein